MSGFPVLSVHNLKVIAKFGPLEKLLHGFIPLEKLLHAFILYTLYKYFHISFKKA